MQRESVKSKMRRNCLSVLLLLCLLLLQDAEGSSLAVETDESCQESQQLEEQCGPYAHKIVKPMMAYFDQVTQKIDENNAEMERKNEEINKLVKEVASCTSQERIIKLLEDKDESNRELIKSLQQQIYLLKNTNEKVLQLETEAKKAAHKLEENEALKKQVNLLTNSIDKQNIEMTNVKLKLNEEAEKVLQYENQLKSQKEIIFANEPNIPQIETEIKKLIHKSNEIEKSCIGTLSGIHKIKLSNDTSFEVLCNSDIAGPGWNVIQQRIRGGVEFQRDWNTYRNGFGDFWDGDFFLGLEKIHRLTTEQPHELYIHMERFDGSIYYARYDEFRISGEDDQYRLSKLGMFSSTTTENRFSYHKNMKFTTYDRDNDEYSGNCAADWIYGGWWYKDCCRFNMNGKYFDSQVDDPKSLFWINGISLKQVRMMIRPKAA